MGNTLGRSFFWNYLDKITTQGLSLVISIILARLIAPDHYGIIAIANIFITFLDAFVNPGFTSALIQKKTPESIDYSTVFWSNSIISVVLYLIVFLVSPVIEDFYKAENLALVIRVLALKLPFAGTNSIVTAYIRKNFMYKQYFLVSFLGTASAGIAAIVMAFMDFGIWALVVYSLGNCALDAILSLLFIPWKPTREFSKQRLKSLYSFGGKMLGIKLIDVLYTELNGLIIGKKYTLSDLSYYNKGIRYPEAIMQSLSMSISDVMFPSFSNIQDDLKAMTVSIRNSIRLCNYFIYPMAIGFLACGDNFVEVVLTNKWAACVPYLRICCLYYLCQPSSGIMYQSFKALGKGGLIVKLEIFYKMYGLLFIVLAVLLVDSPIALSVAKVAAGFISMLLNLICTFKYTEYRWSDYLNGLWKTVLISAIMLIAVLALNLLKLGAAATLGLQIIVGVAVYIGLSWLFKHQQFFEVLTFIKDARKRKDKSSE